MKAGRPLGEFSARALSFARETQLDITHLDIAHALQMPRGLASKTLFNLRQAGYLEQVGEIMQAGARRPVAVCAVTAAGGAEPAPADDAGPLILVLGWPR